MRPLTGSLSEARAADLRAAGVRVDEIGYSAEGRPLHGLCIGDPELPLVSVVAGAHPDEPAGPVAVCELLRGWPQNELAWQVRLAVVPVLDVDGIAAQRAWLDPWEGAVDLPRYLAHRLRREPGQDREFAWPGAPWGGTVLPECAVAADFLDEQGPAIAHLSLHGMAAAQGAWFLLDPLAMGDAQLWEDCRRSASELGLGLHEFPRFGDKGFRRAGLGFCTTPSGPAMRRHFLGRGDRDTAAGFGFGSMDSARARARRARAPAPLCAVSEFPLLRVGRTAAPNTEAVQGQLRSVAMSKDPAAAARAYLRKPGVETVPLESQVGGMVAMVEAVVRAALRRRDALAASRGPI